MRLATIIKTGSGIPKKNYFLLPDSSDMNKDVLNHFTKQEIVKLNITII
jgi:hypothetical protein